MIESCRKLFISFRRFEWTGLPPLFLLIQSESFFIAKYERLIKYIPSFIEMFSMTIVLHPLMTIISLAAQIVLKIEVIYKDISNINPIIISDNNTILYFDEPYVVKCVTKNKSQWLYKGGNKGSTIIKPITIVFGLLNRIISKVKTSHFWTRRSYKSSFSLSWKKLLQSVAIAIVYGTQSASCNDSQSYLRDGPLEFSDILPENARDYDKMAPPREVGHPTVVYFHVTVMSLDSIDESSMTYAADIFFAQSWKDWRLRLPDNMTQEYRLLPVQWLNHIWRPDSFFKNAKDVTFQEMTIPNHYIWLYQDKTILYMVKLTLVLSCAMSFQVYPHDSQECSMKIESLSHTTSDLVFIWDPQVPLVVDRIELPQLDLVKNITGDCTQVYSTGNFTCLEVLFTFKRRLGYYLFHTYIPTCLIVIMSWISFWLRPEAVPARVTLGVTSLLTLTTQHANSQKSLPPVSYIKAIDVFMSSCMVFVFFSLMEYAVVNIVLGDICDEVTRQQSGKGKYFQDFFHLRNLLKSKSKPDSSRQELKNLGEEIPTTSRSRKSPTIEVTDREDSITMKGRVNGRKAFIQAQSDMIERDAHVATSPFFDTSSLTGIQSMTPLALNIGLPPAPPPPVSHDKQITQIIKRRRKRAILIDRISRVLFPLSFTVLNVIYWSVFVIEWDLEWLSPKLYS